MASVLLVVFILTACWCYFTVLTHPCLLPSGEGGGYLLCDLFWANVLLPVLLEKFFFTKSFQSQGGKLALFGALLAVVAFLVLASTPLIFCLLLAKAAITFLRFRAQQEQGWIADVSLVLLLAGVVVVVVARRVVGAGSEEDFLELVLAGGKSVICITLAMLGTRCLGRVYLERWLLQRQFNEAHINLALLLSALAATLPYLALPLAVARTAAEAGLAWVVWAEAAESFEVHLPAESDYSAL
jgi:GAF domain-containing protein